MGACLAFRLDAVGIMPKSFTLRSRSAALKTWSTPQLEDAYRFAHEFIACFIREANISYQYVRRFLGGKFQCGRRPLRF